MRMTSWILGALSLALVAPVAAQGDRGRFSLHDRDEDGAISRPELMSTTGVVIDVWDLDGDGRINDREVTRAMFRSWDADGDREVTRAEYERNARGWLPEGAEISFRGFDIDRDGSLSLFEMYTGLRAADYFRQSFDIDDDGWITARELANGLIATLDRDDDGALTRREWPLA